MKKIFLCATLALASAACVSCSNDIETASNEQSTAKAHVRLAISTAMDITTRASLTANDKTLTDIYIFDYDKTSGKLLQVLHQTSTATDFAEPDLTLDYGQHTLKVIASRSELPTLIDVTNAVWQHTSNVMTPVTATAPIALTAGKILDTFGAQQDITISAGTANTVNMVLERLVAKLILDIKDKFPTGCSDVQLSLSEYKNFEFTSFSVTDAVTNQRTLNVSDLAGTSGTKLSFFFLTPEDGYITDVIFTMNRTQGAPFAQFSVSDIPFDRNKVTTISGSFYNHQQGFKMSVNDEWNSEGNQINI